MSRRFTWLGMRETLSLSLFLLAHASQSKIMARERRQIKNRCGQPREPRRNAEACAVPYDAEVAMPQSLSILSPTGHLGFTPIERGSFDLGVARGPDAIVADSGSCDIGPQPLGADEHCSPEEWQRHDLELMLLAARWLGVPMIVGSASDTGTNRGVDQYARIIRALARQHGLEPFRLATIHSEVDREEVARRMKDGMRVEGLDGRAELTAEVLGRTDRVVAVMGVAPIIEALDQGAEVIIAGRSSDSCIFAAPAIRAGFPEASSYYLGKVLDGVSFAAEPF